MVEHLELGSWGVNSHTPGWRGATPTKLASVGVCTLPAQLLLPSHYVSESKALLLLFLVVRLAGDLGGWATIVA